MDLKKLFSRKKKTQSRLKRAEYQDRNQQPRLPESRAQALTLQEPFSTSIGPGVFQRLPLELRLHIYEAVLGHRTVHIAFELNPREYRTPNEKNKHQQLRWWHCICTRDRIDDELHKSTRFDECRSGKFLGDSGPPNKMMGKLKLDFALLLTCRQIYSEAIDILYSTTTFNFASRQLLCDFPLLVLPHRFARINSIEMMWEFVSLGAGVISDVNKILYNDMWTLLADMPNLRRVRIAVVAHECPKDAQADLQDVWLGPLAQLGKMDFFELIVPESYRKRFHVDQESNFTLRAFPDISIPFCTFRTPYL